MTSSYVSPPGTKAPPARRPGRRGRGPAAAARAARAAAGPGWRAGVMPSWCACSGSSPPSSAVLGAHATQVLAVARAVPAGAALTPADLTVVSVHPAAGVATVPGGRAGSAGRPDRRGAADPRDAAVAQLSWARRSTRRPARRSSRCRWPRGRSRRRCRPAPGWRCWTATPPARRAGSRRPARPPCWWAWSPRSPRTAAQTVVSLLVDTAAVPAVEQLASPVLVLLDPSGTDVP